MQSWQPPAVPTLQGNGKAPRIFDAVRHTVVEPVVSDGIARLYVCGITPYDATHLGHAFTYLAFDTLQRAWRDAGFEVRYVQNITDVDDPLLERATQTQVNWRTLADSQIALFRSDMHALRMLPPERYIAVTESIALIAQAVQRLRELDLAYDVPTDDAAQADIYFDVQAASQRTLWRNGSISGLNAEQMLELCLQRGGDPNRLGKRSAFDPMLWRGAREGEPRWETVVGPGRPGWHIECSAIAVSELGVNFTVQGGGADLLFPHHEYSAAHATAITGAPLAQIFAHAGLVAYDGEKMSKSRGNLVFVSRLLADGLEPGALRLALLSQHYRSEWEWRDEMAAEATETLARWRHRLDTLPSAAGALESGEVVDQLRNHLSDDLNTPSMTAVIEHALVEGVTDSDVIREAVDALLGIRL